MLVALLKMAQVDDITRRWISGFTIVLFLFSNVLGFNLDTKAPIIKEGRSTSYFGYSVAHHLVKNRDTDVSESVILVGAPRDNITDATAPPKVRQIIRPGAVYQCPYSSRRNDCVAVKLDVEEPRADEDKNDQWMGVSVSSQGTEDGKALACAHRYKKAGASFRWGLGLCVSLSNTLDEDNFWEPCDGLKKDIGHGEYGFCQAGVSSAISKDGDMLLGAPGPYNWRGALFKNTLISSLDAEATWYQSPVEDPTLLNPGPIPATPYYSYLGMSVKIGKIINGRKTYVGGAPRANDTGHVLLFQFEGSALTIKPEHYLFGEQFGSYFGHDFAIGDFNIDGREDIAVGAPFYRDHGVGGAIYIYMNGPEGITSATEPLKIVSRKMKDQECTELDCQNARFGFALANIGDVDKDGFDDLAVGAPYEGKGAVYIFRGSASGIIKEFSQRISASQFPVPHPQAFGASVTGNFDIDSNGYSDVVVGAFVSDEVFILRARPVVNVMAILQSIPETIDPKLTQCAKDGQLMNCFEVKVCFRFKAEPVDRFSDKIDLNYTIEAEKFTGAVISRVAFKVSGKEELEKSDMIQRTLRLNEQSNPNYKCREHLVYILKNNKDFLSPIAFQLTYRLQDAEDPVLVPGGTLPDMNFYPVLNDAKTKSTLSVNFLKNCGDDELCHSKLKLTSSLNLTRDPNGVYVLRVGQDDVTLATNDVTLTINVQNMGEDAHEATVIVVHPKFLTYRGTDEEGKKYSCTPVDNTVVCILGNPLPQSQNANFTIRLDTSNAVPSRDIFDISVNVSTTSVELNKNDDKAELKFRVVIETDLHVIGDSDPQSVYFGGEVRGESAIKFEDQIGSEITHSYEIKNIGRARVSKSTVFISWPYELQSTYPMGKHVLYILEEPLLSSDGGRCYFEKGWINPLNIKTRPPPPPTQDPSNITRPAETDVEENQYRFRRRREVEPSPKVERSTDLRRQINFVNIDCEENSAKCYRFNCSLGELLPGRSAVLKIRARLWNSTFLEDFSHFDEVRISSVAEVRIDPSLNIHQMNTMNDIRKITTTAKPEVQEPEAVPIWVIIVAVIAGVILLAVIILLLCKKHSSRSSDAGEDYSQQSLTDMETVMNKTSN